MKRMLLLLAIISSLGTAAQTQISQKPLSIGEIRVLKSAAIIEDRQLNIYLPQAYDKQKSYPVVYVLDGSLNEDFLHLTGLVQFFNLAFTMPDAIVVGLENVDRKRDFTYRTELADLKREYPTTGHSDNFMAFLQNELLPYIASNYKVTRESYLIGQSLGGLLACEILVKKPQLFSHYIIISPSLWWDDESLLREAKTAMPKNDYKDKYVYVSVGGKEHKTMQKDADAFYKILTQSAKGAQLDFVSLPEEDHATILHQSVYKAFTKLFKKRY